MNGQELPLWVVIPATLLLVTGGIATLIGGIGLLRMRDFFSRAHPPAMCITMGAGCVVLASMLVSSALQQRPVYHELLIALFVVITAPVTAILLFRAAISRRKDRERGS